MWPPRAQNPYYSTYYNNSYPNYNNYNSYSSYSNEDYSTGGQLGGTGKGTGAPLIGPVQPAAGGGGGGTPWERRPGGSSGRGGGSPGSLGGGGYLASRGGGGGGYSASRGGGGGGYSASRGGGGGGGVYSASRGGGGGGGGYSASRGGGGGGGGYSASRGGGGGNGGGDMGLSMLQRMGWRPGEGLGIRNDGSLEPPKMAYKSNKRGLAASEEQPRRKPKKAAVSNGLPLEGKHPISFLTEYCTKMHYNPPVFSQVSAEGPPHLRQFIMKITINGKDYQPEKASMNKKTAKTEAALVCLRALGLISADLTYE